MRVVPNLIVIALLSAFAEAQQQRPIGELQSSDAAVRGAVVLAAGNTQVMSGSQITAGSEPATIRLTRGGEIRLCPNASVSMTASTTGKEQLVGLTSGSIEAHYMLTANSDTVVTPDFKIQLPGPGTFDFAFGTNDRGDVCVESLPGNGSSVVVNEQFGDGTHQVKPGERVLFHDGKVANADRSFTNSCGCPPPSPANQAKQFGFPEQQSREAAAAIASGKKLETSAPLAAAPATSEQTYVQVDAPVVFRGDQMPTGRPATRTAPVYVSSIGTDLLPFPQEMSVKTMQKLLPQPEKKWYQKLGDAFSGLFR